MHLIDCSCILPGSCLASDLTGAAGRDTTSVCFGAVSQILLEHGGAAAGGEARMIADRSIGHATLSAGFAAEMPLRFPSIRFRTLQLTHQP